MSKRIVLGVTGSIAAYRAAELASTLAKEGIEVDVVLTDEALHFITALTFAALTRREVYTRENDAMRDGQPAHISLADRADLVVVDDIGLLPVGPDAAEGLYRIVDAAYERRSVAVSSNLHPSGFDELMPKTLATATVDRLMHHAHVCQTKGDSIRLTQAIAGQGVIPLS